MFNVQPSEERFSMFGHDLILKFEPSSTNHFEYYLINSHDGEVIEMWVERPTMGEVALAVEAWIEYGEDEWFQEMVQGPTPEESLSYLTQIHLGPCIYLVDHVPFFAEGFPFPLGHEVLRVFHLNHETGEPEPWDVGDIETKQVMMTDGESVSLLTAFALKLIEELDDAGA